LARFSAALGQADVAAFVEDAAKRVFRWVILLAGDRVLINGSTARLAERCFPKNNIAEDRSDDHEADDVVE
jgi:hypothetical protein